MELDPDFSEFIESCIEREVRFLVVGAHCLKFDCRGTLAAASDAS